MRLFWGCYLVFLCCAAFSIFGHEAGHDVVLVTQIFLAKDFYRSSEVFFCLLANLNNRCIDRVLLVQPADGSSSNPVLFLRGWRDMLSRRGDIDSIGHVLEKWIPSDWESTERLANLKLRVSRYVEDNAPTTYKRLIVYQALNLVNSLYNASLKHPYTMLANADIFFDGSLCAVRHHPIEPYEVHFLSRHEFPKYENSSLIKTQCGKDFVGSADVVSFRTPIPPALIQSCDFPWGLSGSENRLLWEFERFGYLASNPCHSVVTWHVHRRRNGEKVLASFSHTPQNAKKSSVAFPQNRHSKINDDYPWQ